MNRFDLDYTESNRLYYKLRVALGELVHRETDGTQEMINEHYILNRIEKQYARMGYTSILETLRGNP